LVGLHFLASLLSLWRAGLEFEVFATIHSPLPPFLELDNPHLYWLKGDLTEKSFCDSLPSADIIIHAAGSGQPGIFTANPFTAIRINTAATDALLGKLLPGGTFLFLSSSEVYSGLQSTPFIEEQMGPSTPFHPRAGYIEGKRCGEALCGAARKAGIDAKAIRLSLAYGPGVRQGDRRVLFSFIECGLREGKIELMDQGTALRAFCYVSDAVEMMWNILQSGRHPVYNVGGKQIYSIRELAEVIGRQLNVPVILPPATTGLVGAPEIVQLSLARYEDEFGPMPHVDLETGIQKTIRWFRSAYEGK
jgi:UDP-glucuronate decarboxylase